jgi:hypothetical protein
MTIDEALEKAKTAIDAHIDEALVVFADIMRARGATDTEFERELDHYKVQLAEWQAKVLADIRKTIERGGATAH